MAIHMFWDKQFAFPVSQEELFLVGEPREGYSRVLDETYRLILIIMSRGKDPRDKVHSEERIERRVLWVCQHAEVKEKVRGAMFLM
jgi:hypothetical protein